MDININFSYGDEAISNLAFVKALLIKHQIEKLDVDHDEKERVKKEILKELAKTGK